MRSLESMFLEEHDNYTTKDVVSLLDSQSPVEKTFAENAPTVQAVPQNILQKGLEEAGIGLEQAAKFLEDLGSINIGGVELTLRDLLPVDKGTSDALKTLGSGMPLTQGGGLQTRLKPEFAKAAKEVGLATTLSKPLEKGISAMAKSAMKHKGKVTTGAAALAGAEATKEKAK